MAALDKAERNLWIFARQLRIVGMGLSVEDVKVAAEALELRGDFSFAAVHHVLSAVWVRSYPERSLFDQAYSAFAAVLLGQWNGAAAQQPALTRLPAPPKPGGPSVTWLQEGKTKNVQTSEQILFTRNARASPSEWLPPSPGDAPRTGGEWRRRLENLAKPCQISPRRMSARRGTHWDMAKIVRRLAQNPDLFTLWRWKHAKKARCTWFLWDCSRSMEPFIPVFFPFFRALTALGANVRIYAFSTRISDITGALKRGTDQEAYRQIFAPSGYLRGGTRLTEALETLARDLRSQGGSHTNVALVTDGFDAGSSASLLNILLKISRRAHLLIWWNPWMSQPGYAPLALAANILSRQVHHMEAVHALDDCVEAWSRLR